MLGEISWEEFLEHQAYELLDPFPSTRADWYFASVCHAIWSTTALHFKARKTFKLSDFLVKWVKGEDSRAPTAKTPEKTMKLWARMFTDAFNAPEKPRGRRNGRSS